MAIDLEIVIRIAGPMPGQINYGEPSHTEDGYEVLAWRNGAPVNIGPTGERHTFTGTDPEARQVAAAIATALAQGADFPLHPTPNYSERDLAVIDEYRKAGAKS